MYYPESEKLLAELPAKEEDITAIDELLHNNKGRFIILSKAAFFLDLSEDSLNRFLNRYQQMSVIVKEERAKCPVCPDEIIESDFSPDRDPWYCSNCGNDFHDDDVEKVDCYRIKPDATVPAVCESPTVFRSANQENTSPNGGGMIVTEEAVLHGRTNPWTLLKPAEYVRSVTTLGASEHDWVREMLQSRGFCLIRMQGQTPTTKILEAIEDFLGPALENQNGFIGKIKEINPSEAVAANTGDSAKELPFHTDGTQEQHLPPAILVFQYLTTPSYGGQSTFLDLTAVIHEIAEPQLTQLLIDLSHPDTATSAKKGLTYTGPLVVPVCNDQSLSFRLRFDDVLQVAQPYQQSFELLKKRILGRSECLKYAPQEGDIAIFDNWRVMHGRKSLEGGRHLRFHNRMWISSFQRDLAGQYLLGVRGLPSELLVKIKQTNRGQS